LKGVSISFSLTEDFL